MSVITLLHGKCLELMDLLPEHSVEAIITDLPYQTTQNRWDVVIPFEPLWAAVRRVLKPRGVFVTTAAQPFTSALVMSNPGMFKYCWVWDKAISTGFLNAKKQPLRQTEDVCVFYDKQGTYNPEMEVRGKPRNKGGYNKPGGSDNYGEYHNVSGPKNNLYYPTNLLRISNAAQSGKVHPTQKPVDLYRYLIRTYTNPGETVLDITMGSGTTGVSAVLEGRNFVGIEKDDNYFRIASERIHNTNQQP